MILFDQRKIPSDNFRIHTSGCVWYTNTPTDKKSIFLCKYSVGINAFNQPMFEKS